MTKRQDAALAVGIWLASFLVLQRFGTWLPLTGAAVSLAAVVLAKDPALRASLQLSLPSLGLAVLAAAGLIVATYLGYDLVRTQLPSITSDANQLYTLLRPERFGPAVAVALLSITAAAEEVLFRGRLMPLSGPAWRRAAIGSAIYASAHLTSGSPLLIALALGLGLLWSAVRLATGSLLAAILVHVAWDLSVMIFHPLV